MRPGRSDAACGLGDECALRSDIAAQLSKHTKLGNFWSAACTQRRPTYRTLATHTFLIATFDEPPRSLSAAIAALARLR